MTEISTASYLDGRVGGFLNSFLRALVSPIRVFQRLFRVFVGSLVIFFAMMHSCRAMSVCGEIVELGRSLVRVVWHGVPFGLSIAPRGTPGG
jgi:hypothetical protein